MFVDTAKANLEAGKGGDGAVSFRHEIYVAKGGPDGGDGGRGGSIIFKADKDTNTLINFRFQPILKAENGKNGAGQRAAGRSGKDLIVEVPIGTIVRDENGDQIADLTKDQQQAIIAKGGDGGFGNAHFKSSVRQTPRIAEVGEPGEVKTVEIELKLLADVGLVGLPNAGKSTFLSVVSNAKPEIADYPFTTITPNLGVATVDKTDILIADIPGLIEGAAEGKGLGHAFLRHVDRTAVLLHLIDVYNDDAGRAYTTIRHELEKYSELSTKPEIIALTKCEGLDPEIIAMQKAAIAKVNPSAKIFAISAPAHQGTEELLRALAEVIANNRSVKSELSNHSDGEGKVGPKNFSGRVFLRENGSDEPRDGGREECPEKYFGSDLPVISERPEKNLSSDLPAISSDLPVISLPKSSYKTTWQVSKLPDGTFKITGEKIEKFARRTDLNNYASVNRLRDIMKKLGIRAELTNQGATPESLIEIAGKTFTLVEN